MQLPTIIALALCALTCSANPAAAVRFKTAVHGGRINRAMAVQEKHLRAKKTLAAGDACGPSIKKEVVAAYAKVDGIEESEAKDLECKKLSKGDQGETYLVTLGDGAKRIVKKLFENPEENVKECKNAQILFEQDPNHFTECVGTDGLFQVQSLATGAPLSIFLQSVTCVAKDDCPHDENVLGSAVKLFKETHGPTVKQINQFVWGLFDALKTLQKAQKVHGDLHTANIYVDLYKDSAVTLIDYGLMEHCEPKVGGVTLFPDDGPRIAQTCFFERPGCDHAGEGGLEDKDRIEGCYQFCTPCDSQDIAQVGNHLANLAVALNKFGGKFGGKIVKPDLVELVGTIKGLVKVIKPDEIPTKRGTLEDLEASLNVNFPRQGSAAQNAAGTAQTPTMPHPECVALDTQIDEFEKKLAQMQKKLDELRETKKKNSKCQ